MRLTDNNEFYGHEETHEVEQNLEDGPLRGLHETVPTRGQDKGVPCCYGQSTYEEVLVSTEMRGQVKGGREKSSDVRHG